MSILRIKCLGEIQIELNGEMLTDFETDKARALLVYLALESGRPLRRSHLAGVLWSEETEERALHNLRQTLTYLRKALGENTSSPTFILANRESIQLNPSANIWIDAKAFTQYLSCAYRHYQSQIGRGLFNVCYLKKALGLYRGQFLFQFYPNKCALFEEWALLAREDFNLQAIKALALLAKYHERRAEYNLAIQTVLRIVELSPWDETAHAQAIRLLGVTQQWNAAKSQFFTLKKYLKKQLSVSPSTEVVALYDQICLAATGKITIPPDFPPVQYQLPNATSPFVGRETELDEIMDIIVSPENHLITLVGPGGIGKTRFALEISQQLVGVFSDGIYFISLITAQIPEQIIQLIAESMNFALSDQINPQKQLIDHLRDKQLLLVLDNFEHLLGNPENNRLLDSILCQASRLTLLVTSRERLNLQQECIYALAGLTHPQDEQTPVEKIGSYGALNLFARCATQKQRDFVLNETNLPAVIRICRILEGLPLGVELAAATIFEQGYEAVAEKIEHDLDALSTSVTNIQPRHRSLHAAFEVSWGLLPAKYQEILNHLSVFPDGFDRRAAQEITGVSSDMLLALVAKSLIRYDQNYRFSFHKAIRHFVIKKSTASGKLAEIRERHAQFYVSFLAEKNFELKGTGQTDALSAIQFEYSNVDLAWNWLVENKRILEMIRCMDSLYQFFSIRSYLREGIQWFQNAIQNIENAPGNELARGMLLSRLGFLAYLAREKTMAFDALLKSQETLIKINANEELAYCRINLGWAYHREKDFLTAQDYVRQSLEHFKTSQDDLGETQALTLAGSIQNRQGNHDEARVLFNKALALCRKTGNQNQLVTILNRLGDLACCAGQYEIAVNQFTECLEISEHLNDHYNQAVLLNNLGTIYHVWKDYPQAQKYYQKSLHICQTIGDQDGVALALNNLGELSTVQRDYPTAIKYSESALQIAKQIQENWTIIVCFNSLGEIYCEMGELEKSKKYFLQAIRLALEIKGMDLVARVSVNSARAFQRTGDFLNAIALLQAALAHASTEHDSREKAVGWLREMNAVYEVDSNDQLLTETAIRILCIV